MTGGGGRQLQIERTEARLRRYGAPRLQMAIIVTGSAVAAFLTTAGLLALGVEHMVGRYVAAPGGRLCHLPGAAAPLGSLAAASA